MKELTFIETIEIISSSDNFNDYISDILEVLCEKGTSTDRKTIDNILSQHNTGYQAIKDELLDIIIAFTQIIIKNRLISEKESFNLKYLKRLFKIEEGDFFDLRHNQIQEIIQLQLYKLYVDDTIDNEEALYKAGLQELFDLGYEQMADFVNPIAYEALQRGANIAHLDTVFPNFHQNKGDISIEEY